MHLYYSAYLVLLQQEHGHDPYAVYHEEGEDHLVAQLLQAGADLIVFKKIFKY